MDSTIIEIKSYIGEDYKKVPYLYSNLAAIDRNNPNIKIWIEKNSMGDIIAIFLLYHTCLHFYSREEKYVGDKLQEILSLYPVDVVMIPDNQIHMLNYFQSSSWHHVTDYIVQHERIMTDVDYAVYLVSSEDEIHDIAELLMKDPLYFESYSEGSLEYQLKERWRKGFGKIFRWQSNGRTVGCLAVTGENYRFIFYGCLMVDPAFRRQGIADRLVKACVSYGCDINKDCLCFIGIENEASLAMHKSCDNPAIVGRITKCILKNN